MKVAMQRLQAELAPAKGEEGRVATLKWYTGATVRRMSWSSGFWYLTLSLKPEHVRMDRLKSGKAPLLDTHNDWKLSDVIGVIESAELDGTARVRFSNRADVDPIWQDVQDGIIRNASVGALIYKLKDITEKDAEGNEKTKSYLAIDWEPTEVSLVPIGADPNAGFQAAEESRFSEVEIVSASSNGAHPARMEEVNMEKDTPTNAGEKTREEVALDPQKLTEEVLSRERTRARKIRDVANALRLDSQFAEQHIDKGTSIEDFRNAAIDKAAELSERQPRQDGHTTTLVSDEADVRRAAMSLAILNRVDPDKYKLDEAARQYANLSLLEVAKECLDAKGSRYRGLDRMTVAKLAFQSTSDFPNILANVLGKNLRAGYDVADALSQWKQISARRTAPDFKTMSELQLDSNTRLQQVPESGEFKRGALVEGKETWKLLTYGQVIAITRQVIVNDDLGAFTRVPALLGQEVAILEATTVWGIITANGNLSDGIALFAAGHMNLDSGAAIAIDSIGTGTALMMKQTTPGGKTMNVAPRFLVAPVGKFSLALQYTSPGYQPAEPSKINPWAGRLTPIAEARLDAASLTVWYLFADPNIAPVVIYAYLEGQEGPSSETREGFDVDGIEIKIRHDFGAGAIDYRGAVKNPGA